MIEEEDELESSRAPLLDHLTELRTRLIICVVALFAAFGLCFAFSAQIYMFLLRPFEIAAALMSAQKAGHEHRAERRMAMRSEPARGRRIAAEGFHVAAAGEGASESPGKQPNRRGDPCRGGCGHASPPKPSSGRARRRRSSSPPPAGCPG